MLHKYGPNSVLSAFLAMREGIPVPTYPSIKAFLIKKGWFNGDYNLSARLNGHIELMDSFEMMTYVKQKPNRWLMKLQDEAEVNNGVITESMLFGFIPVGLRRNYNLHPWRSVQKAFDLLIWFWSVEEFSNIKLVLDKDSYYPRRLRKYMPPSIITWAWFKRCKDESLRTKIQHAYQIHYLPLVRKVSTHMAKGFPRSVELLDLISTGVIGMIEAMQNFDPNRGIKFETFAVPRIRGSILDSLRELDWVPRSVRSNARLVEQGAIQLTYKFGGKIPSMEKLAEHLNVTHDKLAHILFDIKRTTQLSADEMVYREDDNRQVPRIETFQDDKPSILEVVIRKDVINFILEAIPLYLSAQENAVLTMYYWEELTLKTIGQVMGISESRVSQIHTRALTKLRNICSKRFGVPDVQYDDAGNISFLKTPLPRVSPTVPEDIRQMTFFKEVSQS